MQSKITVAIVGVGLIGGSLAISLKEKKFAGHVIGVDKNAANLKTALDLKLIDEQADLEEAVKKAKLVILAIPVDAIIAILPKVLDLVTDQVVMDMGSTKEKLLEAVANHPNRGRLVASHPMAGTEYSGPEAAIPNLFTGRTMVFCDVTQSDEDAFELAENVSDLLGMKSIFMNAKEHDIHTAYVSHIAHITSFALALTVLEKEKSQGRIFELASAGFESTVRLAKSSADMWVPIFKQNRHNVMDVLQEHIRQLQQMYDVLKVEDYDTFHKLIKKSNKIKRILK
ncbi:prephenate dehydrogenase [bacterium A37T11]|nr:prephenate dehydrogenase [bacterium A37T11]